MSFLLVSCPGATVHNHAFWDTTLHTKFWSKHFTFVEMNEGKNMESSVILMPVKVICHRRTWSIMSLVDSCSQCQWLSWHNGCWSIVHPLCQQRADPATTTSRPWNWDRKVCIYSASTTHPAKYRNAMFLVTQSKQIKNSTLLNVINTIR